MAKKTYYEPGLRNIAEQYEKGKGSVMAERGVGMRGKELEKEPQKAEPKKKRWERFLPPPLNLAGLLVRKYLAKKQKKMETEE